MGDHNKSTEALPKQANRAKLAALSLLIISSVSAGFIGGYFGANFNKDNHSSASKGQAVVSSESELITKIAKDVGPSVVSISVTTRTTQASLIY